MARPDKHGNDPEARKVEKAEVSLLIRDELSKAKSAAQQEPPIWDMVRSVGIILYEYAESSAQKDAANRLKHAASRHQALMAIYAAEKEFLKRG